MKIRYPDYTNCIANLGCSILKYYGIEPPNPTLPAADALLKKQYKNIVVILLDGMGVNILEKHLPSDGFFRQNMKCTYSSTFPPTTVAATTAIDSGLFPNQSAWTGWRGYFDEIDKNVVYFWNIDDDTGESISEINAARTFVPYKSIPESIREKGIRAYYAAPFADPNLKSYDLLCDRIKQLCEEDSQKYIYAYWYDPDSAMHKNGIDSLYIKELLCNLEENTKRLAEGLSDTLLIVTADHGQVNVKNKVITDYPDICECLVRMPSMESRTLNFFIKNGMEEQFEAAFNKHFSEDFILMPIREVYERKLLGTGKDHVRLRRMLGNYIAVATDDIAINNVKREPEHKGDHAGLTEDEMVIPFIAFERYGRYTAEFAVM